MKYQRGGLFDMKFKLNNKYSRWGVTAFLVIAAGILFYYFLFHGTNILDGLHDIIDILMPVIFGFAIAYLMTPVLNYIERKLLCPLFDKCGLKQTKKRRSVQRGLSIFFTAFLFLAVIYLLLYMMISQLVPSVQNIISNFGQYRTNIINWVNQRLEDDPELEANILQLVNQYSAQLNKWISGLPSNIHLWLRTVTNTASNILGGVWNFIIGFIIAIYVLASKEKFAGQAKKILFAMFDKETANITIRNFRFTHRTFIGFLGGKIADSIIIGLLCFIGTTLLKTPYAALVSVIIGFTNVIPFFGPYLGAIPSAILILIVDPMHPLNCIYFVIFILVLQQFDGNFLGPKILGNSTGLTSFWVIFAITFFGGFFGVVGMIVGVPIFAVIYAAIKSIVNTRLQKKELPVETKQYEKLDYIDENDSFHELCPVTEEQAKKTKLRGTRGKKPKEAPDDAVSSESSESESSSESSEEERKEP